MGQAGPEIETWHDAYADRGLVAWGVSIQVPLSTARDYWETQLGHSHPWSADQGFWTGQFFDGPTIGTPAYVVIDLATMQIVTTQEGYSGQEEMLFQPYLR